MNKRPKSREETPKEGSDSKALPHSRSMMLRCTKCKDFWKFHLPELLFVAAFSGKTDSLKCHLFRQKRHHVPSTETGP